MPVKPTIIGGSASASGIAPTRLGEGVVTRTSFQPTIIPASSPAPAATPARPIQVSRLPGTQFAPIIVSVDQLGLRFPGTPAPALKAASALLAGLSLDTPDTLAWLQFGGAEQDELAALVKRRLALMDTAAVRMPQYLSRLQSLLANVLEAMEGGFFKKPAAKVWAESEPEIRHLEQLLAPAGKLIRTSMRELETLRLQAAALEPLFAALSLAGEYLIDVAKKPVGQILLGRIGSIQTSQTLALEQLQAITLEQQRLQELLALVQDGVLVQLPSVYSQMAALASYPHDTQRFQATETLNGIVQLIQRKIK